TNSMETAKKLLPKAEELSRSLVTRHGLYNDGLLTLNGASVATTSCLMSLVVHSAGLYAAPQAWFILVPSLLISLITLFAISRPTSCLMTAVYYVNCVLAALTVAGNIVAVPLLAFANDDYFLAPSMISEAQSDRLREALPMVRVVWLGLIQVSCFTWYVIVAALRHVRSAAKLTLPQ
ncbi:hypothetical protein PENTCL1PPCAC_7810, partial [Pristionchus entomophagus]